MRVLHVAWEFPPLVYGGLGRHVHAVAGAQAAAGDEVTVITQTEGPAGTDTNAGVRIVRRPRRDPSLPFTEQTLLAWVAGMEAGLAEAAAEVVAAWRPDVVHAHDWMVATTATTAAANAPCPLVTTIHATEAGRHSGWLRTELSRELHAVEWRLTNSSQRVITCSQAMKREVVDLFDLDPERVVPVPNGIDLAQWRTSATATAAARSRYAGAGPLLVHTGRLEWEKGMHTLLAAMPALRRRLPGVRLVVAGRGGKESELRAEAERLRLGRCVEFVGWLPESDLHALVAAADVAIVPSRYEPFGLVALEAAALGTPVVVSDTGGLAEFADGGRRALTFAPGDHRDLAAAVGRAVSDPEATARRVRSARESLEQLYSWPRVARLTDAVYAEAAADWAAHGPPPVRAADPPPVGTRVLAADRHQPS